MVSTSNRLAELRRTILDALDQLDDYTPAVALQRTRDEVDAAFDEYERDVDLTFEVMNARLDRYFLAGRMIADALGVDVSEFDGG